jgi:hypothetical protein
MKADQKDLKKRLQFRMLKVLQLMASLQSNGEKLPDLVPGDYLKRGLSLLGIKGRLDYKMYTIARLPVRKFIKS